MSEQRQIDVNRLLAEIRKVACSKCREKIGRIHLPVTSNPTVKDTQGWQAAEKEAPKQ